MSNDRVSNKNVYTACCRLLYELEIEKHISNPYAVPYANYIMSWHKHVPINTVIIGQNPYPQNIYPSFGAAFSYDDCRVEYPPKTVYNLAHDVHNYDGTDVLTAIECFRDSWHLLESGIIFINETVFDKLLPYKSNTRAIKEMEIQNRALQVLLSESYFAGQATMTCIGMGIPAAEMTSIIRSWTPKDLFRIRVMTCKNPAARDIGDLPSHQITIGKTPVSKVLSSIVEQYRNMPPKVSQVDKRRQQNIDALKKGGDAVTVTGNAYENELQSFEDRLRNAQSADNEKISIEDLISSCGSLRRAIENHRNSIASHNINMVLAIESIPKQSVSGDSNRVSPVSSTIAPIPAIQSPRPGGARRRVSRQSAPPESIPAVPETPEPETLAPPPSLSATPSRARRRVIRQPNYTPSEAATEYTTDAPLDDIQGRDMSALESTTITCFANWATDNIKNDPTYAEILASSGETRSTDNDLSRNVLSYIRSRRQTDPQYDAYDELTHADSLSSIWAVQNIGNSK